MERRLILENDLRGAIAREEITPHYQVQTDLKTGAVVGVEALARWHHPLLGPISPAEFIPIAEASGQIVDIGRYMIGCACRDAVRLPANVQVAVNLSVIQIMQGEVMEAVADALMATGLPPQRLKLEVTESVMMMDPKRAIAVLSDLRYLGVSIALDDFRDGILVLVVPDDISLGRVQDRSQLRPRPRGWFARPLHHPGCSGAGKKDRRQGGHRGHRNQQAARVCCGRPAATSGRDICLAGRRRSMLSAR